MNIYTPPDFFDQINNNVLLLDTNVFVQYGKHPQEFSQLFEQIRSKNIRIATTELVILEFIKGTQKTSDFDTQKQFILKIVDNVHKIHPDQKLDETCEQLLTEYKQSGSSLSIPDLYLGSLIKKYPTVALTTSNTNDFPQTIFNLLTHFTLINDNSFQTFGIYSYKS